MMKRLGLFFVLIIAISPIQLFAEETKTETPTTLPADGGEPGKAYMSYTKAFASGD